MLRPSVPLMLEDMQQPSHKVAHERESDADTSPKQHGSLLRSSLYFVVLAVVVAGWLSLEGLDLDLRDLTPIITGLPSLFIGFP